MPNDASFGKPSTLLPKLGQYQLEKSVAVRCERDYYAV